MKWMGKDYKNWTQPEIRLLTELKKSNHTYKEIQEQLPHRSLSSIKSKAERLGLCKATAHELIMRWGTPVSMNNNHSKGNNSVPHTTIMEGK